MAVQSVKELTVYRKGYALAMDVFRLTKRFPQDERYSLTSQIRRSSRSICLNLREAWAKRRYPAHFVSKLTDCDGENSETDTALDFAKDCEYIILGIIGRNGAGKSTLLKILSRITEPTEGRVEMRGRLAALLEVGTGFHPELTGRENVYLNGSILGMTKAEIDRQFEAIEDLTGVEQFIDTPVKRYSSGMHVRLGFAGAANRR